MTLCPSDLQFALDLHAALLGSTQKGTENLCNALEITLGVHTLYAEIEGNSVVLDPLQVAYQQQNYEELAHLLATGTIDLPQTDLHWDEQAKTWEPGSETVKRTTLQRALKDKNAQAVPCFNNAKHDSTKLTDSDGKSTFCYLIDASEGISLGDDPQFDDDDSQLDDDDDSQFATALQPLTEQLLFNTINLKQTVITHPKRQSLLEYAVLAASQDASKWTLVERLIDQGMQNLTPSACSALLNQPIEGQTLVFRLLDHCSDACMSLLSTLATYQENFSVFAQDANQTTLMEKLITQNLVNPLHRLLDSTAKKKDKKENDQVNNNDSDSEERLLETITRIKAIRTGYCNQSFVCQTPLRINHAANPNHPIHINQATVTPLFLAAYTGNVDMVMRLVELDAKQDACTFNIAGQQVSITPLQIAANQGHDDVVTGLYDTLARVDDTIATQESLSALSLPAHNTTSKTLFIGFASLVVFALCAGLTFVALYAMAGVMDGSLTTGLLFNLGDALQSVALINTLYNAFDFTGGAYVLAGLGGLVPLAVAAATTLVVHSVTSLMGLGHAAQPKPAEAMRDTENKHEQEVDVLALGSVYSQDLPTSKQAPTDAVAQHEPFATQKPSPLPTQPTPR